MKAKMKYRNDMLLHCKRSTGEAERWRQRSGQVVQRPTEGYQERLQIVAKPSLLMLWLLEEYPP